MPSSARVQTHHKKQRLGVGPDRRSEFVGGPQGHWLARIDRKIAAIRTRQAETEHGRRNRPRPPESIVELGIGNGSPPVQVHAGDCYLPGKRHAPSPATKPAAS
jgi:hypothetical protein